MTHFVKIYGDILDSSVWGEPLSVRVVWITLLAMADQSGLVKASSDGISRRANVPLKQTDQALIVLTSPDPRSKISDNEGRRVERVEGGYQILNYMHYRELRTEKQIADAERIRRKREEAKQRNATNATKSDMSPEVEVEVDKTTSVTKKRGDAEYPPEFELLWNARPRRSGPDNKRAAFKAFNARMAEGVAYDVMLEGVKRYRAHLIATGKEGTAYVKMCSTFLGPDKHFNDEYLAAKPEEPAPEQRKVSGVIPISRGPIQW